MPMNNRLLRPRSTVHPEANAWATRVIANGGTFSSSTLSAVSTFCASIDREPGLRAAILRLNLLCGNPDASLNAVRTPLYLSGALGGTTIGDSTDTINNFVEGDYQETGSGGGLKGDGSTTYLGTGFLYNSIPSAASSHMSFSGTELETSTADRMAMGQFRTIGDSSFILDITTGAGGNVDRGFRSNVFYPAVFAHGNATSESHLIGTRTGLSAAAAYRGGALAASDTGFSGAITVAEQIYVFAALNNNGSISQHTSGRFRMYSIGNGITAAQALAFSNAVIAFNTALGRA